MKFDENDFSLVQVPEDSLGLRFLYHTFLGRVLLKLLVSPGISRAAGKYLDGAGSKKLIPGFVRKNGIDLEQYLDREFSCFNEFFCRRIRPELRPLNMDGGLLMSPCDGLLSVFRIQEGLVMSVKQSRYSVEDLLEDKELAAEFDGGWCFVFRLCVNHYHRYHFCDDGSILQHRVIPGKLHTVRPIALRATKVFTENSREYQVIQCEHLGKIVQMEVGAMLVGKIENYFTEGDVKRGAEKGRFLYGGSTVIVLVKDGVLKVPEVLAEAAGKGCEVAVQVGQGLAEVVSR